MEEDVPSLAVAAVCHYKYNARCGMAAEEAVPPLAAAAVCQKWHGSGGGCTISSSSLPL